MIQFSYITSIEEAKKYWDMFSPNEELYDDWLLRFTYWQFAKPEILFLVGFDVEKPVGLLPLQWNANGYYEFFGGSFMSYNSIYILDEYKSYSKSFVDTIDKPLFLRWMKTAIDHPLLTTVEKSTYYLPLENMYSLDDYFTHFWEGRGQKRNELQRQIRRINERNIKIVYNDFSYFDLLVKLNQEKLGESSVLNNPHRPEFLKEVINNFETILFTILIDDEPVGAAYRIIYNNIIYGIITGVKPGFGSMGKYIFLKTIELGIQKKCKKYDALEGVYGWKEEFGFIPRPQYYLDLRDK